MKWNGGIIMNCSPLRYPGGKSKLYKNVLSILEYNNLIGGTYVEPFAGGSGLAIKLLLTNKVRRIVLNDKDPAIFCFWHTILNYTEEFLKKIDETEVTIEEWEKQKAIFNLGKESSSPIDYAFSVFFLNRTNVSGILKGGVIGGRTQDGKYKINVRFNKIELKKRIVNIAENKDKIVIYNLDANELITGSYLKKYKKVFINFDPPYVKKGAQLYMNFFKENDHIQLSKNIKKCSKKWIVTYDVCDLITDLYRNYKYTKIDIRYSAKQKKISKEYMFFSKNINIPPEIIKGETTMINCTNECRFCSILKKEKKYGVIDTPIMQDENFYLLTSIGALVEGWTMIIPKDHCYSMKDFYTNTDFQKFFNKSIAKISKSYKNKKIIAFEHGANKFGSLTACGTNHAHTHLLPFNHSLLNDITEELTFNKVALEDISNYILDKEYLLYMDIDTSINKASCYIHILEKPISQFFRKIIANKLNIPEKYDYKQFLNIDISESTVEALQKEVE